MSNTWQEFASHVTQTQSVIEKMMTEPVGHLLDSGGIYGRAYQKRIDSNFTQAEIAWVSWDNWAMVDVRASLYHHLCRTVLFNEQKQHEFDEFAKTMENETWENVLQAWVTSNNYDVTFTFNSLDYEYSVLDGVFVAWIVEDANGDECVVIRTHNGCDYNGGYSAPYMFDKRAYKMMAASGDDCDLFDVQNIDLVCMNNLDHNWYQENGFFVYAENGTTMSLDWNGEFLPCPICGGKLVADK